MSDNRRDFLKSTVAGSATLAAAGSILGAYAGGAAETIKVGVIGNGGRGSGAVVDVLESSEGVEVHALADLDEGRQKNCIKVINDTVAKAEMKEKNNKSSLTPDRCFTGLDAYKKLLETDVNYVILATPPGFRPMHLKAAVAANKHIFTEKPVAVDGPGIRMALEAYEEAVTKKLCIVAGTQRRHQKGYIETIDRIHNGEIGDVQNLRCHWNQGILWLVKRAPTMTDLQWQLKNWYYFLWLCGDHIVEQHVHNLDVCNWVMKGHPIAVDGMGYNTRTDPAYGHIYNFFSCDYEYANNIHMHSTCRQISNCSQGVDEWVRGTKGVCDVNNYRINNKRIYNGKDRPYVQEHTDLIASIRSGKVVNELKQVAESTLTAIMGRMSAYTGKRITWEMALNSKEETFPKELNFEAKYPTPPLPIPGTTEFR